MFKKNLWILIQIFVEMRWMRLVFLYIRQLKDYGCLSFCYNIILRYLNSSYICAPSSRYVKVLFHPFLRRVTQYFCKTKLKWPYKISGLFSYLSLVSLLKITIPLCAWIEGLHQNVDLWESLQVTLTSQ